MNDDDRRQAAILWMRASHAAFERGVRTVDVAAGERAYQKWRKREQRLRAVA